MPISTPSWSDVRSRAVATLRAWVGLPDGAPYEQATGLLVTSPLLQAIEFPNDPPAVRAALARQKSGCGLTRLGLWRALGLQAPELAWAFDRLSGKTIATLIAIATRAGAWSPGASAWPPSPGDGIVVEGSEHEINVLEVTPTEVISVDGGQPGIALRRRPWHRDAAGKIWIAGRWVYGCDSLDGVFAGPDAPAA